MNQTATGILGLVIFLVGAALIGYASYRSQNDKENNTSVTVMRGFGIAFLLVDFFIGAAAIFGKD